MDPLILTKQSKMCELVVIIPVGFSFVLMIVIPFPKEKILKTFGDRSFSVAAPKL